MRLIFLLLALGLLTGCDRQKPAEPQANEAATPATVAKGVDRSQAGKPAPDATFKNPDGGDISLADFEGVPTLVNLWATWCAPCVKELPTLQKLEDQHAIDGQLGVVAVSQDMSSKESVDAFLKSHQLRRFAAFHDPAMALSGALGVEVMPTTILYGSDGKEIWRYVGDLDWTGAEAGKLLSEAK